MLGEGTWTAYLQKRGGGTVLGEIDYASLSNSHVVDDSGQGSVTLVQTNRNEIRRLARPWEHEVVMYRDDDVGFVGPLVGISDAQFTMRDLSYWLDKRVVSEDFRSYGDFSNIFRTIFEYAMAKDPSPNINLVVHDSGTAGIRSYKGSAVQRAGDLIRELGKTSLDYTTVNRTIYVGGPEVFAPSDVPGPALLLHDEGVVTASVDRDGDAFATDVYVFSGHDATITSRTRLKPRSAHASSKNLIHPSVTSRTRPLEVQATAGVQQFGLVELVFTDLLLREDLDSALQQAQSRLAASQPAPMALKATLSPYADFTFSELIPGRRVDVRLSEDAASEEVVQTMRLSSFDVSVGTDGEKINLNLVPLGIIEQDA